MEYKELISGVSQELFDKIAADITAEEEVEKEATEEVVEEVEKEAATDQCGGNSCSTSALAAKLKDIKGSSIALTGSPVKGAAAAGKECFPQIKNDKKTEDKVPKANISKAAEEITVEEFVEKVAAYHEEGQTIKQAAEEVYNEAQLIEDAVLSLYSYIKGEE